MGYTDVKITTCLSENQGAAEIYLESESTDQYFVGVYDDQCSCIDGRSTILASVGAIDSDTEEPAFWGITAGVSYSALLYTEFTGNYAISVECGTSQYSLGDIGTVCDQSNSVFNSTSSGTSSTDSPFNS